MAVISNILGTLTFASLVTAIIINTKASSYVTSVLTDKISNYQSDSNAADLIDRIQTKYSCCSRVSWVDWADVHSESQTVNLSKRSIPVTALDELQSVKNTEIEPPIEVTTFGSSDILLGTSSSMGYIYRRNM